MFRISENLISSLPQEYQDVFKIDSKVCDFCNAGLPKEWVSLQCIKCPTIFDRCDTCSQEMQAKLPEDLDAVMTCHKDHSRDNSKLSPEEFDAIENREKHELFKLYGEGTHTRLQVGEGICAQLQDENELAGAGVSFKTDMTAYIEERYKYEGGNVDNSALFRHIEAGGQTLLELTEEGGVMLSFHI